MESLVGTSSQSGIFLQLLISSIRWGVVSYADSLDCVGILAEDVNYVESVFSTSHVFCILSLHLHSDAEIIAHYDHRDPSAATPEVRQQAATECANIMARCNTTPSLSGLRIGIPRVTKCYSIFTTCCAYRTPGIFPCGAQLSSHKTPPSYDRSSQKAGCICGFRVSAVYSLRSQRVLCNRQCGGEQQLSSIRWHSIRLA